MNTGHLVVFAQWHLQELAKTYMYMYMYMLYGYVYVYVIWICIWILYSSTSPRHEHVVVIRLAVSGPNDMPANCAKRCGLCGAKDHNVRTCGLPGAQKFRNAIRKTRPVHLKEKSRVLRGTGVAAMRKPGKKAMFLRMPLIRKR